MRLVKTTTISILAVGLLAGSAVGVAAQDDTDSAPIDATASDFCLLVARNFVGMVDAANDSQAEQARASSGVYSACLYAVEPGGYRIGMAADGPTVGDGADAHQELIDELVLYRDEAFVIEGSGVTATAPFDLAGRSHHISVAGVDCERDTAVWLRPTDTEEWGDLLSGEGYQFGSGPERSVYLEAIGGCPEWSVTFTPFTSSEE